MTEKLTVRQARRDLKSSNVELREAVTRELTALGASEITDILTWDASGNVTLTPAENLSEMARKTIKKVKVTPGKMGATVEVEMHDKVAPLRLLAKHTGMLDGVQDQNKPSILNINLKGPDVIEVVEKDALDRESN
jgi:hypothetical protein